MLLSMIDPSILPTIQSADNSAYQSWQKAGQATQKRLRYLDSECRTAGPIPYFGSMIHNTALAAHGPISNFTAPQPVSGSIVYSGTEKNADYSFGDVVDMVNPLQQLPIVGMVYRKLTDDDIKPISKMVGGALYGGPIGAIAGTVNAIFQSLTGRDVSENALAMIGFDIVPEERTVPTIAYQNEGDRAAQKAADASYRRNFASQHNTTDVWNA